MKKCFGLLFLSGMSLLAADSAAGVWKIEGNVSGTAVNQTCTVKQDGAKLSGSCESEAGSAPLEGEITGQKFSFKHGGEYQGTKLTVTYSGTIDGDGMKGTIDVDPFNASGDFTGARSH